MLALEEMGRNPHVQIILGLDILEIFFLFVDEDDVDIEGGETNSVSDSALKDDTVVAYTNDRSGLIPTGVKLPVIPIVVSGILLAGGIVLLLVKKERE